MVAMNNKQALTKARAIWGKTACVEDAKTPHVLPNGAILTRRFKVGHIALGMFFSIEADGDTWEDAFARYEQKQQIERERIAAKRKELGLA